MLQNGSKMRETRFHIRIACALVARGATDAMCAQAPSWQNSRTTPAPDPLHILRDLRHLSLVLANLTWHGCGHKPACK